MIQHAGARTSIVTGDQELFLPVLLAQLPRRLRRHLLHFLLPLDHLQVLGEHDAAGLIVLTTTCVVAVADHAVGLRQERRLLEALHIALVTFRRLEEVLRCVGLMERAWLLHHGELNRRCWDLSRALLRYPAGGDCARLCVWQASLVE